MIPDSNMDLHSTMNSTRINVSKINFIFFLILNAIKLEIITGRVIKYGIKELYVYSLCKSKMYANHNTKDGSEELEICCCKFLTLYVK